VSDLDQIRTTYADYHTSGRERLWVRSNRGYARLIDDRDRVLLPLIAASLPAGGGRFLDVGCGSGELLAAIVAADLAATCAGIDLLPSRIETARSVVPAATLVAGSAEAMPFDDGAFDVAAALTLFSSLPSAELERAVAREIGRVLRPGGWLVWYDLRRGNPTNPAVHGIPERNVRLLFPGWKVQLQSITLAPPIARRLGVLTPLAYPVLHAVPPLRSHLIGRLRRPG
jgi:SAM-dependent methyltransferase